MSLVLHGNGFMRMSIGIWSMGVVWELCGTKYGNESCEWVFQNGNEFCVKRVELWEWVLLLFFKGLETYFQLQHNFFTTLPDPVSHFLLVTWPSHDYHMIPSSLTRVWRKPENMKPAQSSCLSLRRDLTFRKNSRTFTLKNSTRNLSKPHPLITDHAHSIIHVRSMFDMFR